MSQKLVVVGAGLCGTMLAIRLAQRGYSVALYERRADMRNTGFAEGRSINLALSDRGIQALKKIGLEEIVHTEGIPMHGRMIHKGLGETSFFPYSGSKNEYINSISRGGLNIALLNKAETYPNLSLHFSHKCEGIDFSSNTLHFFDEARMESLTVKADSIFGTDGAGSAVRQAMMSLSGRIRFDYTQKYLSHGYKELTLPPLSGGAYSIEKEALHIWPRGDHMVIALPNLGGSFTVTLFQDFEGPMGLNAIDRDLGLARAYFEKYFPDALALMPDFEQDILNNPSSSLGTIKCYPWAVEDKVLLLGDAAHAIVPFYGQGMNASFEDVYVLDELMERGFSSWSDLFMDFQRLRKPNADAIADLAVDNFYEMRDSSGDPIFQKKTLLEKRMEQEMPDKYFSKYAMVTFREDIPYHEAMVRGRKQDEILLEFCRNIEDVNTIQLEEVLAVLEEKM
jgi:kynurenine 3-monooxygenase